MLLRTYRVAEQLAVVQLVVWGVLYYTFSVLLPDMQQELGWDLTWFTSIYSGALLLTGLAAPAVGSIIDRHGAREVMASGVMLGTLGLVVWSLASSMWVYALAWVLIALGMACACYAPAFAAVVRLCPEQSLPSIFIITMGGALASTVSLPVTAWLTETLGWREALQTLAIAAFLIALPLTLTLPGVQPLCDGGGEDVPVPASGASRGLGRLTVALMLASFVSVALDTYLVVLLMARGSSLQIAAWVAGLAGVAKLSGRLFVGVVRRVPAVVLMRASLLVASVALLFPLLSEGLVVSVVMVFVVGASSGARTILRPALLVQLFGARGFGARDGTLQLFTSLATAAGPVGFGVVLGMGDRRWVWGALALCMFVSTILMWGVRAHTSVGEIHDR